MTNTGLYNKIWAQVFIDGFSFGWWLDNNEGLTHVVLFQWLQIHRIRRGRFKAPKFRHISEKVKPLLTDLFLKFHFLMQKASVSIDFKLTKSQKAE